MSAAALQPSVPAEAADDRLAELAERAEHDGERVLVTRAGKPVAALVPIEDVEALEALEDELDARLADEALASWEAEGRPPGISHEELLARSASRLAPSELDNLL